MKHTEAKAFVRKYNAELSIRGYSKMKKADLERTIESKINKSREELQREWSVLKGDAAPVKRPPSAAEARGAAAGARARAGAGQTKPSVKRPAAKRPVAAKQPVKVAAKQPVAAKRSVAFRSEGLESYSDGLDRVARRAATGFYDQDMNARRQNIRRDTARSRRIRGNR